jgi:hypothetical protein
VTELRFHRTVYRGTSLDAAVKVFASYATFELKEEPDHWVVKITSASPEREKRIAGELGNYALGLTIKAGGAGKADDVGDGTKSRDEKVSAAS